MDQGHMHDMPETVNGETMNGTGSLPKMGMHGGGHVMMHMTFFWGKNAQILFSGWPGTSSGMYVLSLIFIFFLALLVEWLSHCDIVRKGSGTVGSYLVQTLVHAVRVGLAYMVMLAVMSFNVGVFLVAIGGHAVGFFLFGTRVFKKQPAGDDKTSDLTPMIC